MNEVSILSSVLSLGVGGVLGIVIFLMYRIDRKNTEERWQNITHDLVKARKEETESREKNTKVLTELIILVERVNGKRG